MGLLQARLRSRLQVKGIRQLYTVLRTSAQGDPNGWVPQLLIDLSTVNHTSFFREPAHFTFMAEGSSRGSRNRRECRFASGLRVAPRARSRTAWRWSWPKRSEPFVQKAEIWASDLSLEMLKLAAGAIYTTRDVQGVSQPRLRRFFLLAGAPSGVFSGRARDPRHGQIPSPRSAEPGLDGPQRLSDHFLPQRVDLFCRRRAVDSARPAIAALAAGRVAGHGQWRDPAGRAADVAKALSVAVPERGLGPMALRDRQKTVQPSGSPEPIEVLVVDDSGVVRQKLKSIIETDPGFRVVLAADPYEAVGVLAKSVPGVIVLDVEMPRMDGLTFLRKLMRQHPLPVVLCTSQAERAVTVLEMGAIEVIAKPDWNDAGRLSEWSQNLLDSIRAPPGPGGCRFVRTVRRQRATRSTPLM